jgi:hypothetical protein
LAISPQLSERVRSLAARVDAMMNEDDEPARGTEASLDLDELEEVEDVPAIPAIPHRPMPSSVPPFRAQAPTPPPVPARPSVPSVVMVPPRTASKTPSIGARPLMPRSTAAISVPPMPVPAPSAAPMPASVAIPPREPDAARGEPAARMRADEQDTLQAEPALQAPDPETSGALPAGLASPSTSEADSESRGAGRARSATGSSIPLPGVSPGALVSASSSGALPAMVPPGLPPPALPGDRGRRGTTMPPPLNDSVERMIGSTHALASLSDGGVEVSTGVANIVVDQPLETHLESPTVLERALDELGDAGGE